MSAKYVVVYFCGRDFEGSEPHETEAEAKAYCNGFNEGSGKYGGDGMAFVLPGDESALEEVEQDCIVRDGEVEKARKAAREILDR